MVKRFLLVCLAVCVVAMTGCAELKQLRRQRASLQEQLNSCARQRDGYRTEKEALLVERDRLQTELTAAKRQSNQVDQLERELKAEQAKLEQQRRELQTLVGDIRGITIQSRPEGNFIVMESDILFALGKTDLNEQAKKSLDEIARYLLEKQEPPIRIDGHTDGVPIKVSPFADNHHLAAMRAHAVMRYLAEKGVSPGRMHVVGFGPNRPRVEPEEPTQAVAENRRVEILLVPEGVRSPIEIIEGFLR